MRYLTSPSFFQLKKQLNHWFIYLFTTSLIFCTIPNVWAEQVIQVETINISMDGGTQLIFGTSGSPVPYPVGCRDVVTLIPEASSNNQACITSGTQLIVDSATQAALRDYSTRGICMAQELHQRAPSVGEALAATYTLIAKAGRAVLNETDQRVVHWLENRIKERRILAAQLAKSEYDRWKGAPCHYQPPVTLDNPYNPPASLCNGTSLLQLLTTVSPPQFAEIGAKLAYRELAAAEAVALIEQTQQAVVKQYELSSNYEYVGAGAAGVAAGGIAAAIFTSGAIMTSVLPYAVLSATAAIPTVAAAGPIGIVVLAVTAGVLEGINVANREQLPGKLDDAIQRAQNETVSLSQLLNHDSGRGEVWGNFLLATLNTAWTPQASYDCSTVFPAANWWFKHTQRDASSSHYDEIMNYESWDGSQWTTKIVDGRFVHAPGGDWGQAHSDDIINYRSWDGSLWTARIENELFVHAPDGDFSRAHNDTVINYKTWGGNDWSAFLHSVTDL